MKQRDIADPTLTCVQIEFINKLLRDMAAQPPGNGSITIVIHNGHLIYIVPAPNLSGLRPSGRSLDWPQPGEQDDPCLAALPAGSKPLPIGIMQLIRCNCHLTNA